LGVHIRVWRFALVGWLVLIFLFSSDLFSAEHTEQVLIYGFLNVFVRKCAHMIEYAILMYLWFRSLYTVRERFYRTVIVSVVLSVLYAASDEWHQSFIPSRDGTITDVGWDATGAILMGIFLWYVYVRGRVETKYKVLGPVVEGEKVYNT
jgi:hypothetical protein